MGGGGAGKRQQTFEHTFESLQGAPSLAGGNSQTDIPEVGQKGDKSIIKEFTDLVPSKFP